jgi:hypothetical protein
MNPTDILYYDTETNTKVTAGDVQAQQQQQPNHYPPKQTAAPVPPMNAYPQATRTRPNPAAPQPTGPDVDQLVRSLQQQSISFLKLVICLVSAIGGEVTGYRLLDQGRHAGDCFVLIFPLGGIRHTLVYPVNSNVAAQICRECRIQVQGNMTLENAINYDNDDAITQIQISSQTAAPTPPQSPANSGFDNQAMLGLLMNALNPNPYVQQAIQYIQQQSGQLHTNQPDEQSPLEFANY